MRAKQRGFLSMDSCIGGLGLDIVHARLDPKGLPVKKWRAPQYDDQLDLDDGVYVIAEKADPFGSRAFMVVNIFWEEREVSYLSDAATDWGLAPWALDNARESMRVRPLGTWSSIVGAHAQALSKISQACREIAGEERFNYCALLLLRAALRLDALSQGKSVGIDVARHCLRQEIERDAMIQQAKQRQYMAAHPDWTPPKPCFA
jgi:hypothetical protein